MKSLFAVFCVALGLTGTSWAGPGTSGGTPGSLMRFTYSSDHREVLFGDVLFDARSGEAIGRPMEQIGMGGSALSPDGHLAVSFRFLDINAPDSFATIWNVASGQPVAVLAQGEPLGEVRFTPDGKKILTLSLHHVKVWDAASGMALADLPLPSQYDEWESFTGSMEFTASSRYALIHFDEFVHRPAYLAVIDLEAYAQIPNKDLFGDESAGGDEASKAIPGTELVAIYDPASAGVESHIAVYDLGRKKLAYRVGRNLADEIAFSADGGTLITREQLGKELSYWNARTGAFLRKVDLSPIPLKALHRVIVSASEQGRQLRLFAFDEPQDLHKVEGEYTLDTGTGQLHDLHYEEQSWRPNLMAGFFDGYYVSIEKEWFGMSAFLHSFEDGHVVRTFQPSFFSKLLIAANQSVFLQAPRIVEPVPDHVPVHVFDFATGSLLHTIRAPDGASTMAEAISSSGRYLLYATYPGVETPLLHLWNLREDRELQQIREEYPVGFSDDEQLLVTLNRHKTEIHVWRTSTGELLRNIAEPGPIDWVRFRGKSNDLLIGAAELPQYDYVLQSLNLATGAENFRRSFDPNKHPFNLSDDGTRIATYGGHHLEVWNAKTGTAFFSQPGSKYENCLLNHEGKLLYCVGLGSVTVWDVDQQRKLTEKKIDPAIVGGAVVFSPEDDLLGIGSTILRADTLEPACVGHQPVFQFLGRGQIFEADADQRDFDRRDCISSEVLKKYRMY